MCGSRPKYKSPPLEPKVSTNEVYRDLLAEKAKGLGSGPGNKGGSNRMTNLGPNQWASRPRTNSLLNAIAKPSPGSPYQTPGGEPIRLGQRTFNYRSMLS